MSTKHVPIRSCIGCGAKRPKAELWRFVCNPALQTVAYDPRKKLPGRGAYLCPDASCLRVAQKRRGLDRAYRRRVPQVCYKQLAELFEELMRNA